VVEVVQRVHGAAIDFYALGSEREARAGADVRSRLAGTDEVVEG
jgi:hypothetical protein